MMESTDGLLRAEAVEAYEAIPSLDVHGELTRRHDVPHIQEISWLLDVLWQEVAMVSADATENRAA